MRETVGRIFLYEACHKVEMCELLNLLTRYNTIDPSLGWQG